MKKAHLEATIEHALDELLQEWVDRDDAAALSEVVVIL